MICDPLPEAETGTIAIVWATPLVRLNENPIGSDEVTLTGIAAVTATPSTYTSKYGQLAPEKFADKSTPTL
jgi:hypothetical protein